MQTARVLQFFCQFSERLRKKEYKKEHEDSYGVLQCLEHQLLVGLLGVPSFASKNIDFIFQAPEFNTTRSPLQGTSRAMFLKTQLSWNVLVPAKNVDAEGSLLQKAILVRLLDEFATKKALKDLGYFMAVTTLDHIGEGLVQQHSGDILLPVDFSCITFKMLPGEILDGVVHKILTHGIFLRCGPAEKVYLSHKKMGDYEYVPGENPSFTNDKSSTIVKGTLVRFMVMAEKYDAAEKDFQVLVSTEGDYLGPVS